MYKRQGYHIIEAENGTRALEVFRPEVDLVILDIMMPGMSGLRAVSYTHLDVYKRQTDCCLNGPACELGDRTMKEMDSQSKLSLKLQAYQYLKTKILNCEYRPNEFLNEQKLCAERCV